MAHSKKPNKGPKVTKEIPKRKEREGPSNGDILVDKNFIKWCGEAGIPPTTRQASRWAHKKGLAYKTSQGTA